MADGVCPYGRSPRRVVEDGSRTGRDGPACCRSKRGSERGHEGNGVAWGAACNENGLAEYQKAEHAPFASVVV